MPMYFDATTVFRAGMGPTTGIPRYERQIIRTALKRPEDGIGLCAFDRKRNVMRTLAPHELAVLEEIMSARRLSAVKCEDALHRFLWARGIIARNVLGRSREFERSAAFFLAGNGQRSGLPYGLSKMALRIARALDAAAQRSGGPGEEARDLFMDEEARIFLSNQTIPIAARRLGHGGLRARIYPVMYDTVPLDTPHFTTPSIREKFLPSFRLAASLATGMICISKHTRDRVSHWCRELGLQEGPAFAVESSSDLVEQVGNDSPIRLLSDARFVVYCSTIEPRKNHLLPLALWRDRIASGAPDVPMLVFCGKKGWSYESVFDFMRDNPVLKRHVLFLHGISDPELAWLYRNALFSIFPSFEEGWGLAASESMDFGTPVVVSQAPALREATQGLMPAVDVADVQGWASTMEELSTSPAALESLRDRIRHSYRRTPVEETFGQIVRCMSAA